MTRERSVVWMYNESLTTARSVAGRARVPESDARARWMGRTNADEVRVQIYHLIRRFFRTAPDCPFCVRIMGLLIGGMITHMLFITLVGVDMRESKEPGLHVRLCLRRRCALRD